MRPGLHSKRLYPLYNCTNDTLDVLLASSDAKVVEVAKLIKAKKSRPRFGIWIVGQKERNDGVGRFARWLIERQETMKEGRFVMPGSPDLTFKTFVNGRWAGVDFPEDIERGCAQALEEWDRWGA